VSKGNTVLQRGHQPSRKSELIWSPSSLPEQEIQGSINVTIIMPTDRQFQSHEIDLGSAWLHAWRWTKALSTYTDPLIEHLPQQPRIKVNMNRAQGSASSIAKKVVSQLERTRREIWSSTALVTVSDQAAKAITKYKSDVVKYEAEIRRSMLRRNYRADVQRTTRATLKALGKAQDRAKMLRTRVFRKCGASNEKRRGRRARTDKAEKGGKMGLFL
jgi:hypothetical protein